MAFGQEFQGLLVIEIQIVDEIECQIVEIHTTGNAATHDKGGNRRCGRPGVINIRAAGARFTHQKRRPSRWIGDRESGHIRILAITELEAAGNQLDGRDFRRRQAVLIIATLALQFVDIKAAAVGIAHQTIGTGALLIHLALEKRQLLRRDPVFRVLDDVLENNAEIQCAAAFGNGGRNNAVVVFGMMPCRHHPHAPTAGTSHVIAVEFVFHCVIGPGNGLGSNGRHMGTAMAVVEPAHRIVGTEVIGPQAAVLRAVARVRTRHGKAVAQQLVGGCALSIAVRRRSDGLPRTAALPHKKEAPAKAIVRQHQGPADPVGSGVIGHDMAQHLAVGDRCGNMPDRIDYAVSRANPANTLQGTAVLCLSGADRANGQQWEKHTQENCWFYHLFLHCLQLELR